MTLLLIFAFLAGVLTILAPCTLPMVPLVLGAATGGGRARPLGIITGLAVSFTLFSVVLAAALDALGLTTSALRGIAVVVLAVFGFALLWPALGHRIEAAFAPLARVGSRTQAGGSAQGGFGGGVLLGAALGLIWAPCSGPIMATVISLAATRGTALDTAAIALVFTAGAGIPLLAIAYGGRALAGRVSRVTRSGGVQQAFGALMLLTCLAIWQGWDTKAQDAFTAALPAGWTAGLYSVEQGTGVQKELQALRKPNSPALPVAAVAAAPVASPTPVPSPTPSGPVLPAPVEKDLPANVKLEDGGLAPEVVGITDWINSGPQTLAGLRGKVVLVHFWTFGCYNCRNVQPHVEAWYARYKDAGFTVLGIHTPELSFEKDIANVRTAVKDQGVLFPVAFDPQYATWGAYHNGYWPAFYYVDKTGHIRHTHVGEGNYNGQEQVIRQLLREPTTTGN